jgi:hypothetical protein
MGEGMNKIIEAQDILADARSGVECIFLAASELTEEGRNPIHTVADIASKKIDEAIALLKEYSRDLPVPAAPAKPKSPAPRPKRKSQ